MHPEALAHAAWMDAFFAAYYEHRPVHATFIGVHDLDDRLPDLSEGGVGDALARGRDLLERSTARAERRSWPDAGFAGLDASESIDLRLARGFLRIQAWELESGHGPFGNPSLYTGEAVFGVMGLFLSDFAPLADRVDTATARMDAIDAFLARARDNVRRAPRAWTERAVRECDGALAFFSEGVAELAAGLPTELGGRTRDAFLAAAARSWRAFVDHRTWLGTELLARPCEAYACGDRALGLLLEEAHFLDGGAEEVERYAMDQLAEGRAWLARSAADFGASEPAEALARLSAVHPSPEAYYARYAETWDEVRRLADERALLTWPDFPIRFVPRPGWARRAAPYLYFLFYRSPAAFARPAVHDYLVAPLPDQDVEGFLRANNQSVIKLNHVIHHGGLGHHVQNWHAFRAASRIGRIAAVDCASRIAMACGGTMAEGWACYATDLAAEAGALTPLERYAEKHARVRMAARALVDMRLHRGELTLEAAATYYESHAGMSPAAAQAEAVKNSMVPGGALIYLMGTDAIHRLRAEMERRAGSSFDLKRFHDTFLSYGSIPVSMIAAEMMKGAPDDE